MVPSSPEFGQSVEVASKPPTSRPPENANWRSTHEVVREIGRDGCVLEVRHLLTNQARALKYSISEDRESLTRLKREIDAMLHLRKHPHVVQVLEPEAGEHRDWYTMPLLGPTLANVASTMSDDEIARMVVDVAGGLNAAHNHDMVHRDVSPNNILATADLNESPAWQVGDFGLVKHPSRVAKSSFKTRGAIGTSGFTSPEVLLEDDRPISAAADVFSLGRVLAWVTSGHIPRGTEPLAGHGEWAPLVARMTAHALPERIQTMTDVISGVEEVRIRQRAARAKTWGVNTVADLRSADEITLAWIINNGSGSPTERTATDETFRHLWLEPAVRLLALRRLRDLGLLVGYTIEYDNGGYEEGLRVTPFGWEWAQRHVERIPALLADPTKKPARAAALDELPF